MTLKPYDFRDIGALVEELIGRAALGRSGAHLLLVRDPPGEQHVVRCERLDTPAVIRDWEPACDEMRDRIEAWPVPDVVPPTHAAVLVVVRPGLCVLGANEGRWCKAWRYVNHLRRLYDGHLLLVTEHGWRDRLSDCAGSTPALRRAG